jgi:hypothetical protein
VVGLMTYTSTKSFTIYDSRLESGSEGYVPSVFEPYDYETFARELEKRGWTYRERPVPMQRMMVNSCLHQAVAAGIWAP